MKKFINTFLDTLRSETFYRSVAEAPLKDAFKFYALFIAVISLFITVVFSITLVPKGVRFVTDHAPEIVKKYYPQELIVEVEQGKISVNVNEPYFIPVNGNMNGLFRERQIKNTLVIDTQREFSKEEFEEYSTFALLTKEELVTQSTKGQITIQDIPGAHSFTISQGVLLGMIEKVRGALSYVVPAGIVATFFILLAGFVLYLVPILAYALVPLLVGLLRKMPLTYTGAFKITLYAVLPGLFLRSVLNALGYFFVPASLPFLIFLLIVVLRVKPAQVPTLFNDSGIAK